MSYVIGIMTFITYINLFNNALFSGESKKPPLALTWQILRIRSRKYKLEVIDAPLGIQLGLLERLH